MVPLNLAGLLVRREEVSCGASSFLHRQRMLSSRREAPANSSCRDACSHFPRSVPLPQFFTAEVVAVQPTAEPETRRTRNRRQSPATRSRTIPCVLPVRFPSQVQKRPSATSVSHRQGRGTALAPLAAALVRLRDEDVVAPENHRRRVPGSFSRHLPRFAFSTVLPPPHRAAADSLSSM